MNGDGKRCILLVDDDEWVRSLISRLLERLGYCAVPVASGGAAIAWVTAGDTPFDLVILDMMMPDMSGEDTFLALRALKPSLFFILCSGSGETAASDRLLSTGHCVLLGKPFSQAELRAKIEGLLSRPPPPPLPSDFPPAPAAAV